MVNTFEKQENQFDSRIHSPLRDLDIEVVYGCNLNCPQCCRLSGLRKGYLPVEKIVEWVEPWSKRIRPRAFCISGGEPLLHPQLPEVIYEIRRMYPDFIITIFTNGTLPHRLTQEVLTAMQTAHVGAIVSIKPYMTMFGKDYTDKVHETIRILKEHRVRLSVDNHAWRSWIDDQTWKPANNNPDEAFGKCWHRGGSQVIFGGNLYLCATIRVFQMLRELGKIDAWDAVVMDYPVLTPDCTDEQLRSFLLDRHSCEQCRFCPLEYPVLYEAHPQFPIGRHAVQDT